MLLCQFNSFFIYVYAMFLLCLFLIPPILSFTQRHSIHQPPTIFKPISPVFILFSFLQNKLNTNILMATLWMTLLVVYVQERGALFTFIFITLFICRLVPFIDMSMKMDFCSSYYISLLLLRLSLSTSTEPIIAIVCVVASNGMMIFACFYLLIATRFQQHIVAFQFNVGILLLSVFLAFCSRFSNFSRFFPLHPYNEFKVWINICNIRLLCVCVCTMCMAM